MENYLKSYEMVLHTVSPVFVGSGKNLNKKEYIFVRGRKKVLVPNINQLYQGLEKRGLGKKFTQYILTNQNNSVSKWGLNRWLRENDVSMNEWKQWIRYELDCGDFLQEKGAITICEFQKDNYGLPYVPGTTIKGMLRTILMAYELSKSNKISNSTKLKIMNNARIKNNRKYYLNSEINQLEQEIFHVLDRKDKEGNKIKGAVNDCLSGLIVSDSEPLQLEDMVLCQKVDENTEGKQHALNILRESIKPERNIRFRITIDTKTCQYSIDEIMEAVKRFGELYYKVYLSHFINTDFPQNNTVWVGGGTGFATKTVLYALFGEKKGIEAAMEVFKYTLPERVYKEHKHFSDKLLGVSPHVLKCTQYRGKRYHIGECKLIVAKEI